MQVQIVNKSKNVTPCYMTQGSAGMDVRAKLDGQLVIIQPGDRILISITSTVETNLPQEAKDKYINVLELRFDDLSFNPNDYNVQANSDLYRSTEGMKICDNSDIDRIEWFIERHSNIDIDIHCSAGVSRSGAVALGIAIMKNDEKLFNWVLENNSIFPNERILCRFIERYNPTYECMKFINIWNIILKKPHNCVGEILNYEE